MEFSVASGKDVNHFDHYLYESFRSQPTSWVMNNYIVDRENECMAPAPEYYDLKRYLLKNANNQVVSGISLNFNWKNKFQIESMGYNPPNKFKSLEVLNFYIRKLPGRNPIKTFRPVMSLLDTQLSSGNFARVFATCIPRLFNFYLYFGWKAVTKIELDSNKVLYVIQYSGLSSGALDKEAV